MLSVLYVDDEPALLEIGRLFLERTSQCRVTTVLTGEEALGLLRRQRFDAVISDYQMPGMDGLELLRLVRASGAGTPFILFTGRGREEVVVRAFELGADFYLQKGGDPGIQFAELLHKVLQAVRRREAERTARENEDLYRTTVDAMADLVHVIDADRRLTLVNRTMVRMCLEFGFNPNPIGLRVEEAFPMLPSGVLREYDRVFAQGAVVTTFETLRFGDREFSTETRKIPVVEDGQVRAVVTVIRDVSEQQRVEIGMREANERLAAAAEEQRRQYAQLECVEEHARESHHLLQEMADNVPGVLYRYYVEPDGTQGMEYVTDRAGSILGLQATDDDLFEKFLECLHPDDLRSFRESIDEAVLEFTPWEWEGRFHHPSGRTIWLSGSARPHRRGSRLIFHGVLFETTARRESEESLRMIQERLALTLDAGRIGLYDWELQADRFFCSDLFSALFGLSSGTGIPSESEWLARVHPDDRERVKHRVHEALEGRPVEDVEYRVIWPDGTVHWLGERSTVLLETARPVRMIGAVSDQTDRRAATGALIESERRLSTLMDNIPGLVYRCRSDRD